MTLAERRMSGKTLLMEVINHSLAERSIVALSSIFNRKTKKAREALLQEWPS